MRFNLFNLHNSKDDLTLRHCLRAYTVLPKYCGFSNSRNQNSEQIIAILQKVNKKAKKIYGLNWKTKWAKLMEFGIKSKSMSEWIYGRSPIPLIALQKLKNLGFTREVDKIMGYVSSISSSTREIIHVPKFLNNDLLYLAGLILSDGCFHKFRRNNQNNFEYGISIYSGDGNFFQEHIIPLLKRLFHLRSIEFFYHNKAWVLKKRNKILFRFFTSLMGLPYKNKSKNARIPDFIWGLGPKEGIPFLAGLIDGDIGKHGKGMGGTFRSEKFVDDVIKYLGSLGVNAKKGRTNILANGYIQNELRISKSEVEVLKDVMAKTFLPKSSGRLKTLFCRGTKAV